MDITDKTFEQNAQEYDENYESNDQNMEQPPEAQPPSAVAQNIRQFGQANLPDSPSPVHVLPIIGQVEGHMVLPPRNKTTKYEHVIPQLVAVEQNPRIQGLLIILNTVGGDIEAGLAIAEMIKTMTKPTVSLVVGGGHSIGTPIAVAADYSFISETATMTIHPIRLTGLVIGVPQTYEYLDKMQDRVIRFIVDNSRIPEAQLREMMFRTGELVRDVGTVLVGDEAVQCGLIDGVGGLGEAIERLNLMIQGQVPRAPRKMYAQDRRGYQQPMPPQGMYPQGTYPYAQPWQQPRQHPMPVPPAQPNVPGGYQFQPRQYNQQTEGI